MKSDGSVIAWGATNSAQATLPLAAQSGVAAIAPRGTMVLKNDGSVVAWGDNLYGQTDVPVAAQSGATALAAGAFHSLALKNDGTVVAWGNNYAGAVTGQTAWSHYSATAIPVTLEGRILSGVTALAAGSYQSVALLGTAPLLPSLNARPSGNQLILSWSTNAIAFVLQSTRLTPPVTWVDLSDAPALIDGKWTITNSFSEGNKFYRLRKP